jgi:hypothetical protein
MTGLPFTDPIAAPAVRTPHLRITGQAGGGPGGLASATGALLGESPGADPWSSFLLAMRLTLGLGGHVDYSILHVLDGDDAPATALGDGLEFSLDYDGEGETRFFTGSVSRLENTVAGYRRLTVASPFLALSQKRLNSSFEEQSASDIVRALLGETDVEAGTVDAGEQYPFYVVGDDSSLLEHIRYIAQQQDWLCYCGPDGRLNAHAVTSGEAARTFAYGVDILELEHGAQPGSLSGIRVVGGGAATSNGAQAWNWLTKDPKVLNEMGDSARVVPMRALRNAPAAQNFGASLTAADARDANRIRLLTPAAPEVLPGEAFIVDGAPTAEANGTYVTERVVISFDRERGFLSRIEGFNRDAAASGLSGALGGLF